MSTARFEGATFIKAAGQTQKVGWGDDLITYTIYVEKGIGMLRRRQFTRAVDKTLADDRSWIRGGKVTFQRVDSGGNTTCFLAKPETVDKLCAPLDTGGKVSCCQGTKVVVNYNRWMDAVMHWTGSLKSYRQMVVNHEFGHRIGKPHRWCTNVGAGNPAPVMQQQTYSLQGCLANSWPLDIEL